jgi:phosphoribosylformylglycinamidine synthase
MEFLHGGRPPVVREACYVASGESLALRGLADSTPATPGDLGETLLKILGSLNVASKEWVIRQYDHEVQGGSVIKPLVGAANDGPSDAAVLRPVLSSRRGIVVACGMNPRYGDFDTYHMAGSAIDEAVRNCVAVGADPSRIAILDNFCWGDCDRPETLGSLVRAAIACHDVAVALGTPFISGKDSLNNEFSFVDAAGKRQTIAIGPTLLISAIGQIADVGRCVSMDLKSPGNVLYQVGVTKNELGGSHFSLVEGLSGGQVPTVDAPRAKATFAGLHRAIDAGLVRACHDMSEGGLAVAIAEMAFAGGLGATVNLATVAAELNEPDHRDATLLYSESNSRFIVEVAPNNAMNFEAAMHGVPYSRIGEVTANPRLQICGLNESTLIDLAISDLKSAWQQPLKW